MSQQHPYPAPGSPVQTHPAQPYPGQPFPGQPFPGQNHTGQYYGGQPYPGQPYPGQNYPPQPLPYPPAQPVQPRSALVPWPQPLRRPAAVTMAATMAVTASIQFVCVLSFLWLVAYTGIQELPNQGLNVDSAMYHLCRSFHLRMLDGMAWPLYLIPTAAFVLGFLILIPRPWTRWALTLLGVGALVWSGVWLHRQIMWWIPAALYVLIACLLVWTPAASAWFRARGRVPSASS